MSIRDLIKRFLGYYIKEAQKPIISPYGRYQAFLTASGYGALTEFLRLEDELMARYVDYEEMDAMPELSSCLDIYADDATIPSYTTGKTVWVDCSHTGIKNALDELLHNRIQIEDEIWAIARTLVKYGNAFEEIVVGEKGGVLGLNFLPPPTVKGVVDSKGFVIGYCQSFSPYRRMTEQEFKNIMNKQASISGDEQVFEDWEVVHFKLGGRQRWDIYGVGVLEPARWIWRRLILLEDAVLIYRLTRAPSRYIFYVDVGDRPPHEAMQYLQQIRDMYRKKKFIDPATGRLDFKYNPLAQDEDFFIPVRHGREGTRIEVLSGMEYTGIDDLEYFRSKLFAALKIPKAYIGYEGEVTKATLSAEDVRFARTIMRIQRELRLGLQQVCNVHLASLGFYPHKIDFGVFMQVPSAILELAQLEILKARAELARELGELFPPEWILQNIFHLTDEEINNILGTLEKAEPQAMSVPPELGSERPETGASFGMPGEERTEVGGLSQTQEQPLAGAVPSVSRRGRKGISWEGRLVVVPYERERVPFRRLIGHKPPSQDGVYRVLLERLKRQEKVIPKIQQISELLKDINNAVKRTS